MKGTQITARVSARRLQTSTTPFEMLHLVSAWPFGSKRGMYDI